MKDEIAQRIDAGIARLRDEMVDTLRELVRIPSITGNEGTAWIHLPNFWPIIRSVDGRAG